jgi:Caspase domain.
VALRTYRAHQALYDGIQRATPAGENAVIKATVLLISGCQDNQLSADGKFNGLFTAHLRRAWRDGQFKGNYQEFHRAILKGMPPTQTPNYFRAGAANPAFDLQNPFSL